MSEQAWERYVMIGKLGLLDLVNIARKEGMRCIQACKPGMCVYNEIALWGTASQMAATDAAWRKKSGQVIKKKRPPEAFGVSTHRPAEKWVDAPQPARSAT